MNISLPPGGTRGAGGTPIWKGRGFSSSRLGVKSRIPVLLGMFMTKQLVVQSLNSPFFPPHIGTEPLHGAGRKESTGTGLHLLLILLLWTLRNRFRSPIIFVRLPLVTVLPAFRLCGFFEDENEQGIFLRFRLDVTRIWKGRAKASVRWNNRSRKVWKVCVQKSKNHAAICITRDNWR